MPIRVSRVFQTPLENSVHASRLRFTNFGLSVACQSVWHTLVNAHNVVAEVQLPVGSRNSRCAAVAAARQAVVGPAHPAGTAAAAAPDPNKRLAQQSGGQRSHQQAGLAAGWPLPPCAAAVQHSITGHLHPAALRAYSAASAAPAAGSRRQPSKRVCVTEVDRTAPAEAEAPGAAQHQAATPALTSRRPLRKRIHIAEGDPIRAYRSLIWGANSIEQLQMNIEQAAPAMTPAQAAIAFAGVAKMLDSSGCNSKPLAVGPADKLASTIVGIWRRQLDAASVEDMLMVLQAWSKLRISQEHVSLWLSTVAAFIQHPQRLGNSSSQQLSKAAYAIAIAGAGVDSAAATAEEAVRMLAVEFADLLSSTGSAAPVVGHRSTIVSSISRMIAAHEAVGWSLPGSLLAVVQQYHEQLVAHGHEEVRLCIRYALSVQDVAGLVSSIGSTFSAANVAAAATKVAEIVQHEHEPTGAALLNGQLADLWAQKLVASTSQDVRDMLVACRQLRCYDNPVLWGGSLSALLQQMQERQSKLLCQQAQVSDVSRQQQQIERIILGLQDQSLKEQHEPGQQQVLQKQTVQKSAAAKLNVQVLTDVPSVMFNCAVRNQGTIPGLSMCATADVLNALGHQLHSRFKAVKLHGNSAFSLGVSQLMMARAALGIPPSSEELGNLMGLIAFFSQLQPTKGKHLQRIMFAMAKLQRNSTWHPSLDENTWQQLLGPEQLLKVASLDPWYVANSVMALHQLAITVPQWGAAVDAQPCLSRFLACKAISELLAGPVAQDLRGWRKHDVRTSLQACHSLGIQNHVFLQLVHAAAEGGKWGGYFQACKGGTPVTARRSLP